MQGSLRERAIAALLCVSQEAGASPAGRYDALRLFADRYCAGGLPGLRKVIEETAEWPLLLAAVACVALAAEGDGIARGLSAPAARKAALKAAYPAACSVLGGTFQLHYTCDALLAAVEAVQRAVAAPGGAAADGAAAATASREPTVYDLLLSFHAQLQASRLQSLPALAAMQCSADNAKPGLVSTQLAILCAAGAAGTTSAALLWQAPLLQASAHTRLHPVPQGGLKAFAGVELSTCCSLLELLYCDGSPYQGAAVLSKGGKLMAGALRSPAGCRVADMRRVMCGCRRGRTGNWLLQLLLTRSPACLTFAPAPAGAILAAAFCLQAPPADAAAWPMLPWLAELCGFPGEVLQGQAAAILQSVLRA